MPAPIAIATCREYPTLSEDDRFLLGRLRAAGIPAEPVVWDAPVAWDRPEAGLLRSTWDDFERPAAFLAWLDDLERSGIPCFNPAALVRWNIDKRYLRELSRRGVATVPTVWIDGDAARTPEEVARRVRACGWSDVVVKPAVSAGAHRTARVRADDPESVARHAREIEPTATLLVQPFLPEVLVQGETSLLFFGGAFSHAVVKRPRAGDFRVQWAHGGTHERVAPTLEIVEQARAVLAAAPSPGLYARVDGLLREGRFVLMELEQIEPYLFLDEDPAAADRLVAALRAALETRSGGAARP